MLTLKALLMVLILLCVGLSAALLYILYRRSEKATASRAMVPRPAPETESAGARAEKAVCHVAPPVLMPPAGLYTAPAPEVSIIIPCKNEVNTLESTVKSLLEARTEIQTEIIVVDDASTDGSCNFLQSGRYPGVILERTGGLGAAGARNAGAELARGKYFFFCDAHIKVQDYWLDRLLETMLREQAHCIAPAVTDQPHARRVGYGQTWNNALSVVWLNQEPEKAVEVPIACGCALGINREVFHAVGGFDRYFEVWGKEDEELSLKLWLFGYRVMVEPSVKVAHLFRHSHPYRVSLVNVMHNLICLAYSHFSYQRLAKALDLVRNHALFSGTLARVMLSDIHRQRADYLARRVHPDDYFFKKFGIDF
ncbi:MAG: glycosyltransferase [Desulfurispora sp.]|uniref:glycosyltransferase n=1 Tax=Desulfurispora sp. TaxID=3014275 RepID=UPI0040498A84